MSAKRAVGVALITSPAWALMVVGLIVDTRDAAIGFGIVATVVAVLVLGMWLFEQGDKP